VAALRGSGVQVASVATGFPAGRTDRATKLREVQLAVGDGATEIDMVIDRGAFLAGRYGQVYDEICAVKQACGEAHLKVILETGELKTYDNIRRACRIALLAGADFLKTSTGKVTPASTPPVVLLLLEAARDHFLETGRMVGVKAAGGIRTAKDALKYLVLVAETCGDAWLSPRWFRFGASSLLNDVLMQIEKERTGRYQRPSDFSAD
ncbi:MAG: deoxyribose-phosphate aldolase, partial [Planctomycetes bacterium]|nr:deoxyribose-phosphate aldolase [Planctomycetota bacterium]